MSYLLAAGALAAAVLIRYLFDPWMGDTLPLVTLFGAVAAAAWVGGVGTATIVAVAGYFVGSYLFIQPRGSFRMDFGAVIGLAAYLFTCALIVGFSDATRRAQRRASEQTELQFRTARLLASIVESSDDAILSKTLDGTIQSWNAGAERLFGYSATEAIGRHISLVIPPDRLAEEDEIVASLKAGRRIDHYETERMRADGSRIFVSLMISPLRDDAGTVIGASKIVRDVTRQRQAEQRERQLLAEAAAANRKFQAFFEQGALFAGIMHVDGTLVDANRLSLEACGFTRDDVLGKPFWEGPWWSPSPVLADRIKAACAQAAAGATFHAEMPYHVADLSQRVVDITILPIRDAEGRVQFLVPTGVDITDRKRAEAERKKLEDDLRSLAANLSDADRRKNEFLAMLAHELRNPLAPISNAARTLRLGGGSGAIPSAVDVLERQVGQMARLIDDLLDMSRISRGKIDLRKRRVALAPIVELAVESVRPLAASHEQTLTVALPAEEIVLDADSTRLAQVVGNLLSNASKFSDRGGRIWLSAAVEDSDAVIRVKDNGIGIAAESMPHLFDMFAQVDTSLERSRDGLGIGLTLVRTLVELHGGTVAVQSAGLGQGAEFIVRLPVLGVPLAVAVPAAARTVPRRRILIVDDSQDGAESLAMLLQIGGHETHVAHDGVEALAAAERLQPDVVLLDIGLPKLNGYEVCSRIRALPWGARVLLVALTGWGQEQDRRRSQAAGFDHHLVKPVEYDTLLRLLSE